MNATPPLPDFARLADQALRARIVTLRHAVAPVLATNNLPHFTDHSIDHSDQLCSLVDKLTSPLGESSGQLRPCEAFVLYAACYLHDVGMQHQRADETTVIGTILSRPPHAGRNWADLSTQTRRDLLRDHHHEISAEMVRTCVNAPQPTVLGVQLVETDSPGYIAALCRAHCVTPDTREYKELVTEGPHLRMPLLAALLRLADILDESRRRTRLYREKTVELDNTSRMHWWRHYYVADVTFDADERRITLWFDFPPDRRSEYERLIPQLQLPVLEEELQRHFAVLARNNLLWHLEQRSTPAVSSTAEAMPDDVQMRMVEELSGRRQRELEADRRTCLRQLKDQRPLIQRRLTDLRATAETANSDEYLDHAEQLARELRSIGARRDSWTVLWGEYNRVRSRASVAHVLRVGYFLAQMMLDDRAPDIALSILHDLRPLAIALSDSDAAKLGFVRLYAQALVEQCAVDAAIEQIDEVVRLSGDDTERQTMRVRVAELHLLQGDLERAEHALGDEGGPG